MPCGFADTVLAESRRVAQTISCFFSERTPHALEQAVYAIRRDLAVETAITGTAPMALDAAVVGSDVREFVDAIARGDDVAAVAL